MSDQNNGQGARRSRLTRRGRQAAARVVVTADRLEGRPTPQWIVYLAEGKNHVGEELLPDGSNERLTSEEKQRAAQLRIEGDRMRGDKTPQWIVDIAEGKHFNKKVEARAS